MQESAQFREVPMCCLSCVGAAVHCPTARPCCRSCAWRSPGRTALPGCCPTPVPPPSSLPKPAARLVFCSRRPRSPDSLGPFPQEGRARPDRSQGPGSAAGQGRAVQGRGVVRGCGCLREALGPARPVADGSGWRLGAELPWEGRAGAAVPGRGADVLRETCSLL